MRSTWVRSILRQQYRLSSSSFNASLMRIQLGGHVRLVGALFLFAFDQFAVVVPQVSDDFVASEASDGDDHSVYKLD